MQIRKTGEIEVLNMRFILILVIDLIGIKILSYFEVNTILAVLITSLFIIVCNIILDFILSRIRINVLDIKCDPVKYLEMINRQEERYRNSKNGRCYLALNRAVSQMLLGNFRHAKEYLMEIDSSYLSKKGMPYLAYINNLIVCHYELGEIDKAESLYETNKIRLCSYGKKINKSVDILIGERYFYLGEYSLSYEHLDKLQRSNLNKRQYLEVIYRLAQMDVINGAKEQAIEKFQEIAYHGNKLWIAKASQEMLERL